MKLLTGQRLQVMSLLAACALSLSACGGAASQTGSSNGASTEQQESGSASQGSEQSRLVLSYDGGLVILDATNLKEQANVKLAGFNRLNAAGDGKHVFVSTSTGFQILDAVNENKMTNLVFPANKPGHVVKHGGKTVLFADGTGDATIFPTDSLKNSTTSLPKTEVIKSAAPHHGVAIELKDGTFLSTLGTEEKRTGVRALNAERKEITNNQNCPSVHGEGTAANEVAIFGCSDGVLLYQKGEFNKIQAPDKYGRTGNQYTSELSAISVGDYNSNPDSEGYLLNQLVLTDTVAKKSRVIDMPAGASYTWRGIVRGLGGEAYVLASDGTLYRLDVSNGKFTPLSKVIDSWESPEEWQDAHPALTVLDQTLYVTDAKNHSVHAVDAKTGKTTGMAKLPGAPIETAIVVAEN